MGSIESINKILEKLNVFIDFYLKSDSEFAQFFIKHEVNPNNIFFEIKRRIYK